MFARVHARLQSWELFDDEEISHAEQAIKVMANSGHIVNLVQQKHMAKLLKIYGNPETLTRVRVAIIDTFFLISKNIGLRKVFLNQEVITIVAKVGISVLDEQKKQSSRLMEIIIPTIRFLCQMCSVKTNKFYIPGETNLVERLRKRAFDCGTFTALTYIF